MKLTVVMYHHVRRARESRFPAIPGLEVDAFRGQLDYLGSRHRFVSADEVVAALTEGRPLPERAALLTFDDGYLDQYLNAFPILDARGIPALFFPSGRVLAERVLLDVHKIHFILASVPAREILSRLFALHDAQFGPDAHRELERLHPNTTRYDGGEAALVKKILQRGQPADLRSRWVDELFRELVHQDPHQLAAELYMTAEQLRLMKRKGMGIGVHGWDHPWWDCLGEEEQRREIEPAVRLFRELELLPREWLMAYPYGSFTECSFSLLRREGCRAAFTTRPAIAELGVDENGKLPRLDTNDFPTLHD